MDNYSPSRVLVFRLVVSRNRAAVYGVDMFCFFVVLCVHDAVMILALRGYWKECFTLNVCVNVRMTSRFCEPV